MGVWRLIRGGSREKERFFPNIGYIRERVAKKKGGDDVALGLQKVYGTAATVDCNKKGPDNGLNTGTPIRVDVVRKAGKHKGHGTTYKRDKTSLVALLCPGHLWREKEDYGRETHYQRDQNS